MTGSMRQGSSSRKRVIVGTVACLAVTAATIAGVMGSRRHNRQSPLGSSTTHAADRDHDPYTALANANKVSPASKSAPPFAPSSSSNVSVAPASGLAGAGGATSKSNGPSAAPSTEKNTLVDSILSSLGFGPPGILNDTNIAAVGTWKALKGAGHFLCYPADGPELIRMATSPDCTVMYLRSDLPYGYIVDDIVNITDTKIIVGNPIAMPKLNTSTSAVRLFDVYPGGILDVRFVHMYRGFGSTYDNGSLRVIAGGTIRAHPGAHVTATGCVFGHILQTPDVFLRDLEAAYRVRARAYGGHILILGGTLFMSGCTFIGAAPFGNPIANTMGIGGQILLLAGDVVSSGTWHIGVSLYANFFALGFNIAVLGGTYTWVGGGLVTANGAQAQWATGAVIFVGGGALIAVGIEFVTTTAALCWAGMGLWTVGSGVKIFIGFNYVRAYGAALLSGAGALLAVGAGISRNMGGSLSTVAITQTFMGAGGFDFCGTGSMVYFANPRITVASAQASFGAGMTIYNGAGLIGMNWSPTIALNVVALTVGCSAESCLLAGWGLFLNTTRYSYQVVNYFFGTGNTIYVGTGGAVLYGNRFIYAAVVSYSEVPYAVQITGVGLTEDEAAGSLVIYDNQTHPFRLSTTSNDHHMTSSPDVVRNLKAKGSKSGNTNTAAAKVKSAISRSPTTPSGSLIYVDNTIEEKLIDPRKLDLGSLPSPTTFSEISDLFDKASEPDKPYQVYVPKNSKQCYMCGCNDGSCGDHVGHGVCEVNHHCKPSAVKAQLSVASKNGHSVAASLAPLSKRPLPAEDGDTSAEKQRSPGATYAHAIHRLLNIKEEAKLDTSGADVPDTTLMWHELVAYCKNSSMPCADEATVKGVLYDFLDQTHSADSSLTVASTDLHPAVAKVATEELYNYLAPEEHPACRGWTRFNVYATAHDHALVESAKAKWDAAQADPSELLQLMKCKLRTELCDISVKQKAVTTYPRMEHMPAYNPHDAGLVGPSLTVVAADSIAPLAELVAGKTYKIHVQNFPHASTVLIRLRRGVGGDKDEVATIDNFDDSKTVATVDWTVPADAHGTCYLVAYSKEHPLLFTFSTAFDVVNAPTRPNRRW